MATSVVKCGTFIGDYHRWFHQILTAEMELIRSKTCIFIYSPSIN